MFSLLFFVCICFYVYGLSTVECCSYYLYVYLLLCASLYFWCVFCLAFFYFVYILFFYFYINYSTFHINGDLLYLGHPFEWALKLCSTVFQLIPPFPLSMQKYKYRPMINELPKYERTELSCLNQ